MKINGKQHYLWWAVDQDGEPRKIVTDKLRSYGVAHLELMPDVTHSTQQYENNRAQQSLEATRARNAEVQISASGAAVFGHSYCCLQSIQSWGGILFPLKISGISGSVHSKNGVGRLREIAGLVDLGLKSACQYPFGRCVPGMARRFSSHIEKMTTIETIAK